MQYSSVLSVELRGNLLPLVFSSVARRLFWHLDGTFPGAISVMKTERGVNDLEPFFRPGAGGSGGDGEAWHEISQLPMTMPKFSSIEASVNELDQWEYDWVEWHMNHPGGDFHAEYVTYGDLSDEDRPYAQDQKEDGSWEEDSDTEFLIRCCGEDRPLRKSGQRVMITPSAGNHFVTVYDYISSKFQLPQVGDFVLIVLPVVHPWLLSLRNDIVKAKAVAPFYAYPVSVPTEWIVVTTGPEHKIQEKKSWVEGHSPPCPMDAATLAVVNRIRASRKR